MEEDEKNENNYRDLCTTPKGKGRLLTKMHPSERYIIQGSLMATVHSPIGWRKGDAEHKHP